jgi:hypothetical protein
MIRQFLGEVLAVVAIFAGGWAFLFISYAYGG